MVRASKDINAQIKKLRAIARKPTFRKMTAFGDNNLEAIEAQIEVLEDGLTEEDCWNREGEEWTEHVASMARDAAMWVSGESDDKPDAGWKGLY